MFLQLQCTITMNEKMCVLLEISQQANDLTLAEDMQTLFQWF